MSFPVEIVCPACRVELPQGVVCPCGSGLKLEEWNGIPRTLFGQEYWGESARSKMEKALTLLETRHWSDALSQAMPGESVQRHLSRGVGPEIVYSFPWQQIDTVLDVGAGMGFIAAPMARFGKTVVALEAVPQRALFLQRRAQQDGLGNLRTIIANALEIPFQDETFDLITMNGVFEYIGLWGKGDPQRLQEEFLSRAFRLLRPNGLLYVGIETRFAAGAWLGAKDHSGLKFTGLMPRFLADLYCRIRRSPIYGGERATDGYRTYCYTPDQYTRMLRRAGFVAVDVLGAYPTYNNQRAIYPLSARGPRAELRKIVDQPGSMLGRARRAITNSRPLYRVCEDEVLVIGRKSAPDPPDDLLVRDDGEVTRTQMSTSDKVIFVKFRGSQAESVTKVGKTDVSRRRLDLEHRFLSEISRHGEPTTIVRWSTPLATQPTAGGVGYEYRYVQGAGLSILTFPAVVHAERLVREISTLAGGYSAMCQDLNRRLGDAADEFSTDDHDSGRLAAARVGERELQAQIDAACAWLDRRNQAVSCVHGDLALTNAVAATDGAVTLFDWERVSSRGFLAIDLVRLYYDTASEVSGLPAGTRKRVVKRAAASIAGALLACGIERDEFQFVQALFLADQFHFRSSRNRGIEDLLKLHREWSFLEAIPD